MKRYGIFISSPYEGLRKSRQLVSSALAQDHRYIPRGMEMFVATTDLTWKYVEDEIRGCDYFVLIIAGSFGSIEKQSGLPWTQREYEFAKALGKPMVHFFRRMSPEKVDPTVAKFRKEISDGQHVKFWTTGHQLTSAVMASISQLVIDKPTVGWVRGGEIAGANEGLVGFYPRSIEYDFTSFLIESPKIQVLLNDGYNWVRRNRQALASRLASPTHVTQFCLLDPDGPLIDFVAQKSRKKIAEQRKDIYDFCEAVQKIADDAGNQNLEIRFHSGLNTHSLFLNETHVVVTPYFTSVNRFPYLPLLKFKSGTVTYANYLLDFELMFRAGRPYLNSAAARAS